MSSPKRVVEAAASVDAGAVNAIVHTLPNTRTFERLRCLLAISSTALTEAQRLLQANYQPDSAKEVVASLERVESVLDTLLDQLAES